MNLTHLNYFVLAIQHNSFSAAARAANVTQPTVSSAIKSLEREFGNSLVVPGKDGLELTSAGQNLLDNAKTLLGDADRIREDMRRISESGEGSLAIGIRENLLTQVLCEAIDSLVQAYPTVDLTIKTGDYWELNELLLAAKLDLVIDQSSRSKLPDELESELLTHDPLMVFMRPGHPESHQDELSLQVVQDYPHLYTRRMFDVSRHNALEIRKLGYLEAPPAIDIEGFALLAELVAGSKINYVFIWSYYLFESFVKAGRLAAVPLKGDNWQLPVRVCYRSKRLLGPAANYFISDVRERCASLAD